jgi:hypothetical protein
VCGGELCGGELCGGELWSMLLLLLLLLLLHRTSLPHLLTAIYQVAREEGIGEQPD